MQLHLVDGTYELFRAYYGVPGSSAPDGSEVGAVRGLARSMLSLIRNEGATHIGVAFDTEIESFRNQLFDGYKTGEGLEPELWKQFAPAERITRALGFTVWSMREFEADDGLATAAHRFGAEDRVERVLICTPDKDLAQCVEGTRIVCVDRRRRTTMDADGVVAKFGVPPASIPDWLGLVGDNADGIPGIPRWGARSASILLAEYGHIESIPADPSQWSVKVRGAKALAEKLNGRREDAALYRGLATLRRDVPLAASLDELEWKGARRDELAAICAELGDEGLAARVPRWDEADIPF